MKFKLLAIAACLTIVGCAPPPSQHDVRQYVKSDLRTFTVTEIDRPKHFWIHARDEKTGKEFFDIVRSKHCSGHRQWDVGSRLKLKADYYNTPTGMVFVLDKDFAKKLICG